ncbi:MAG: hypothetical protein WA819_10710, partial [Ketobacter sp.]
VVDGILQVDHYVVRSNDNDRNEWVVGPDHLDKFTQNTTSHAVIAGNHFGISGIPDEYAAGANLAITKLNRGDASGAFAALGDGVINSWSNPDNVMAGVAGLAGAGVVAKGVRGVPNKVVLSQTGGGSGYIDPADKMYDAIRASKTDVSTIASNTGIKPQNIQKVKDHVFYNEHLLDRYVDLGEPAVVSRFHSNSAQAEAWKRLEAGTQSDADITWLKHETAERWYEMKYNSGYTEAHDRVDSRWSGNPWEVDQ